MLHGPKDTQRRARALRRSMSVPEVIIANVAPAARYPSTASGGPLPPPGEE